MSEPPQRVTNVVRGVVLGDVVQIGHLTVRRMPSGRPSMAPPVDRLVERHELGERLIAALLTRDVSEVGITAALHGVGGFGKTTMAAWACHHPEVDAAFPGGVLWLTVGQDARGAALAERINDLVFALSGIRPPVADPMVSGAELGRALDERGPVLLVLDDVWTPDQVRPFRIGGRGSTRLITTRIPDVLPPTALRVRVDVMTAEESTRVVAIDGVPPDRVAALVAACGRWPVLLGLVAGVLRRRVERGEEPGGAAERVLGLLAERGPAGLDASRAADRAQAVAATVGASLDLLSPADRERCLDLAIFPDGEPIPLSALRLLWDVDVDTACEELVGTGLIADYRLDAPGPRLLLHDVIRAYLREQREDHAQVHDRLLRAAAGLVDGRWWELPEDADYLWQYLPHHLRGARRPMGLVRDLRWVEAKTRRSGSVVGALADLDLDPSPTAGVLRSALGPLARLFGPIAPATALGATLASRVRDVPGLEATHSTYRSTLPPPLLEPAWPLPDRDASADHTGGITDCAFSPDGALVATSSDDQTVRLWRIADGAPHGVLSGHSGGVWTCAFSPDGALLATAGDDRTVRLWRDGVPEAVMTGHGGMIGQCAFSPDGSLVATASTDGTARLWSVADRECVAVLSDHDGPVTCCAFSPDGALLATGGHDAVVRVWSVRERRVMRRLRGHTGRVQGCSFSPDGLLATAGNDAAVRLWRDGDPVGVLTGHRGFVTDCKFSPTGVLATTGHDETVRLWAQGAASHTLTGHTAWIRRCAFSPDGRILATAGYDGTARLWSTGRGGQGEVLSGSQAWVRGCAFSPDGTMVAAAGDDLTARIRSVSSGEVVTELTGHGDRVNACAFSPDSATLATAASDAVVRLWRFRVVELLGHDDGVNSCRFSPDGTLLASAGDDRTVRLWSAVDGAALAVLHGHTDRVNDCAFSPDGRSVVAAGNDGTVRMWRDGSPHAVLEGHDDVVNGCAFAPDGSMVASSSDDATVILWHADGTRRSVLEGHTGWVDRCAFSPDGTLLASASNDGTVRVWDVGGGRCVAALRLAGPATGIAWHPGGTMLATGGGAGVYLLNYRRASVGRTSG
ncbi:NB-ARC domain-containing protein [Actinosynnema sp. NPDC051121]